MWPSAVGRVGGRKDHIAALLGVASAAGTEEFKLVGGSGLGPLLRWACASRASLMTVAVGPVAPSGVEEKRGIPSRTRVIIKHTRHWSSPSSELNDESLSSRESTDLVCHSAEACAMRTPEHRNVVFGSSLLKHSLLFYELTTLIILTLEFINTIVTSH